MRGTATPATSERRRQDGCRDAGCERAAGHRRADPGRREQQPRLPAHVPVPGVRDQRGDRRERDDDQARGRGADRTEAEQVDECGTARTLPPPPVAPSAGPTTAPAARASSESTRATVPFLPRESTTGRPAPAQSLMPPITSTACVPRATSSSTACRNRLPERQLTIRGRDRACGQGRQGQVRGAGRVLCLPPARLANVQQYGVTTLPA